MPFAGAGFSARAFSHSLRESRAARVRDSGERELWSGDELRVGHWSLFFQKVYPRVGRARHTNLLAVSAKILIGLILFSEVFLVVWLPRKMRHIAIWQTEVAKQRLALALDTLRRRNRKATSRTPFEQAAREAVQMELDARVRYLRKYDDALSPQQRESMFDDLCRLGRILDRCDAGTLVRPLATVDVDRGVRAMLDRTKHEEK